MNANELSKHVAFLKLLTPKKNGILATQLSSGKFLPERIVLSFLAFRSRLKEGATTNRIANTTGLSPSSVKSATNRLGDFLTNRGRVWFLKESDAPSWFMPVQNCNGDHWSDGCAYVKFLTPQKGAKIDFGHTTRRFGLHHAAVLSQVTALACQQGYCFTTESGMSTLLNGVHRRTIGTCLNDLDFLGFITRERIGARLKVSLKEIGDQHIGLFQPKPKPERVEAKPPADPNVYELKGDGYDEWREKCRGLMPQASAEKCINQARQLNFNYSNFADHVVQAVERDKKNRLSGKQTQSNLGGFLFSILKGISKKREEEQTEREQLEAHYAWLDSDEQKAEREQELAVAAADPLHPSHSFSESSILERVAMSYRDSSSLIHAYQNHLMRFIARTQEHDPLTLRRDSAKIATHHLCHALNRINHHYGTESKASASEFITKLNEVIAEVRQFAVPSFDWRSKAEVSNVT